MRLTIALAILKFINDHFFDLYYSLCQLYRMSNVLNYYVLVKLLVKLPVLVRQI